MVKRRDILIQRAHDPLHVMHDPKATCEVILLLRDRRTNERDCRIQGKLGAARLTEPTPASRKELGIQRAVREIRAQHNLQVEDSFRDFKFKRVKQGHIKCCALIYKTKQSPMIGMMHRKQHHSA